LASLVKKRDNKGKKAGWGGKGGWGIELTGFFAVHQKGHQAKGGRPLIQKEKGGQCGGGGLWFSEGEMGCKQKEEEVQNGISEKRNHLLTSK